MEKNVQLIIGSIIVVLALFGSLVLEWEFDKDWISLKKDGKIIVEERWHVESERTWSLIKYNYQRDSCLNKGGEIREYETSKPRCYYPDDFYEILKRSLINTDFDTLETENEIEVTKKSPFYMYGTRGAYAGYVTEEFLFDKDVETEEEFPESYRVNWAPRDTRNYKLVWRVEELDDLNLAIGEYYECSYIFGDIKIDLGNDCEKLDKVVVRNNEDVWFYFKPVRGIQSFDLKLVDPIEEPLEGTWENEYARLTVTPFMDYDWYGDFWHDWEVENKMASEKCVNVAFLYDKKITKRFVGRYVEESYQVEISDYSLNETCEWVEANQTTECWNETVVDYHNETRYKTVENDITSTFNYQEINPKDYNLKSDKTHAYYRYICIPGETTISGRWNLKTEGEVKWDFVAYGGDLGETTWELDPWENNSRYTHDFDDTVDINTTATTANVDTVNSRLRLVGDVDLKDGLVRAYTAKDGDWTFEEVNGTTGGDNSLKVWNGDPSLNSSCGLNGDCIACDGDDSIKLNGSLPTGNISYSFWLRARVRDDDDYVMRSDSGGNKDFSFFFAGGGGPNLGFRTEGSNTLLAPGISGEWRNYVAIHDDAGMRWYSQGNLSDTDPPTGLFPFTWDDPIALCSIAGGSAFFYTGEIDEIYIYDRNLTLAEITKLQTTFYDDFAYNTSANYLESTNITTNSSQGTIEQVKLIANDNNATAVDYGFSCDNGTTWAGAVNDTYVNCTTPGTDFKFNITLTGTSSYSPYVYDVAYDFIYVAPDITAPTFSNAVNDSTDNFKIYSNFTANITISDDTAVDYFIFSTNVTGTWANDTAVDISGTEYNASVGKNISLGQGNQICWYYWANDTAGNTNKSSEECFIVSITAPTHDTPILNASDNPLNRTAANLTVYNQSTADVDNDSIRNIIDWRINRISLAVLNMPFEKIVDSVFNATKDYSDNSNNGSEAGGVLFNATGGYDGKGAFEFNGSQHIEIPDLDSLSFVTGTVDKPFSITSWVKINDATGFRILSKGNNSVNGREYAFTTNGTGNLSLQLFGSNWNLWIMAESDMEFCSLENEWVFVGATYNGNETAKGITLYYNGVAIDSEKITNGAYSYMRNRDTGAYIGRYFDADLFANGTIDELVVYNRSLTAQQMLAIYENKTNLIVSQETGKEDNWQACITPNDGATDGLEKCDELVVQNTPPEVTLNAPVNNTTVPDRTHALLNVTPTDNDTDETNVTFYNGTGVECHQETANVSTSCGGLSTGNYEFTEGWDNQERVIDENWSSYGKDSSGGSSATAYMNYTKPTGANGADWEYRYGNHVGNLTIPDDCWDFDSNILSVSVASFTRAIDPEIASWSCRNLTEWHNLKTDSCDITCSYIYEEGIYWNIGANMTTIYNVPSGGNATYNWTGLTANTTYTWFTITDDGTDTFTSQVWTFHTLVNNLPIVSLVNISSSDSLNRTNGTLTGDYTYSDPDSDPEVSNETQWYNNSNLVTELNDFMSIASGNTSKSDVWIFSVRAYDGFEWSAWVNSTGLTITNTGPVFDQNLTNQTAYSDRVFNYDINCSDVDKEDTVTYYDNTTLFNIDSSTGIISEQPDESEYGNHTILITCGDGTANVSQSFIYEIIDASEPSWVNIPDNITLEYMVDSLNEDFNASDAGVGVDSYFTNDSTNFVMNSGTGVLGNNTNLSVGTWKLNVSVNDSNNNINSTDYQVVVNDTTAPSISAPDNVTLEFRTDSLEVTFNATDFSALGSWFVDDTVNFSINSSGTLTNISGLVLGNYTINVSINDTYNNIGSAVYGVEIQDTVYPYWDNNGTNASDSTKFNNTVYFNVTLHDVVGGFQIFSYYNGSDWVNDSAASWTSPADVLETRIITATRGMTVSWSWWFNDSASNVNETDVWNVTINNTIPVASLVNITSSDSLNRTNGTLTGDYTYSDVDGDGMTDNETQWYNGSIEITVYQNETIVNSSDIAKEETWIFSVKVYDGYNWGNWVNSSTFIVENTNSSVILNAPADGSENHSLSVTLNVTPIDIDSDEMNLSFYDNDTGNLLNITYNTINGSYVTYDWTGLSHNTTYAWLVGIDNGDGDFNSTVWTFLTYVLPEVKLNAPVNGYHLNISASITFNCTPSGNVSLVNTSLYITDASNSSFALNTTNSTLGGVLSTDVIFIKDIGEGSYTWNCEACDSDEHCAFASENWSFTSGYIGLQLDGVDANRSYEYKTMAQITTGANYIDIYDDTGRYRNQVSPFNYTIDLLRENKFNDSTTWKNISSGTQATVQLGGEDELYNATFNITGIDSPENMTLTYFDDHNLFFPGTLVGNDLYQSKIYVLDTLYNAYNITFTSAEEKTIYVNYSNQGDVLNRNGTLNFTMTAFDLDAGNDFDYTENFNNTSLFTGTYGKNISLYSAIEDFYDNDSSDWAVATGSSTDMSIGNPFTGSAYLKMEIPAFDRENPNDETKEFTEDLTNFDLRYAFQFETNLTSSYSYQLYPRGYMNFQRIVYLTDGTNTVTLWSSSASPSSQSSGSSTITLDITGIKTSDTDIDIYLGNTYSKTISISSFDPAEKPYLKFKLIYTNTGGTFDTGRQTFSSDFKLYNMSVSGISLKMINSNYSNVTTYNYTSDTLNDAQNDIERATLNWTAYEPSGTTITGYLSNDNQTTWEKVLNGVIHSFDSIGKNISARFESSTANVSFSPIVYNYKATIVSSPISSLDIDVGNDNRMDANYTYELNATTTPIYYTGNDTDLNLYINNSCNETNCLIPIRFISGSGGTLQITDFNLTENINPITLNHTYIDNEIINLTSTGHINITDLKFDYDGHKNITVTAHTGSSQINRTLSVYYSKLNVTIFPENVFYWDLFPHSAVAQNVEPFGQDANTPFFLFRSESSHPFNVYMRFWNNTNPSCTSTIFNDNSTNALGWNIHENFTDIGMLNGSAMSENSTLWSWTDFACTIYLITAFYPDFEWRSLCENCVYTADFNETVTW